jgi:hypothetical protein
MQFFVAFIVLAALLVLVLAIQRKSSKAGQTVRKPVKAGFQPRNPWRATSIVYDKHACNAVKAIGTKRFLDNEKNTPKLPLTDCDASTCNCNYVNHEYRREYNDDQRLPGSLHDKAQVLFGGTRHQKVCVSCSRSASRTPVGGIEISFGAASLHL